MSPDRIAFEQQAADWFGITADTISGQRMTGGSYRNPKFATAWTFFQMGAQRRLSPERPKVMWACYPTEGLSRVEGLCLWKGREYRKTGYISGPYALRRVEELCREFQSTLFAAGVPV